MPKIFITRKIPESGIDLLRKEGFDVEVSDFDGILSREKLLEKVKGADAILSLLTDKIDGEIMDVSGAQLKIIANYAVGYDNLNLEDAKKRNIILTNTPEVLSETVAEHTFALMLAIAHRIVEADKFFRDGKYVGWAPLLLLGQDVAHKMLGVVGLGRIGSLVAKHAHKGFEMKVLYYDIKRNENFEKEFNAEFRANVEDVLKEADFISLHVPLLPSTKHLINEERLKLMKKSAYLINASRGPVVDENALVAALKEGWIRGAALDVYENEPKSASGLTDLPNVILTPHIASATEGTRSQMSILAAKNIIAVLKGEEPLTPIK
ncbi:MAG: D-isomer specific 2-hydroxyacid dehydrogenase NAD-binding protein [Parcubacteria group bacterium GW2011_GWA2_39_18]|nr:MAG: D-isomer specific 2-hydroxyacid dehydrogenase NAD-binding protein [Parcubacteria group bacterium GW2011_GWA2_39_18]